jgi:hypothetical protein
MTAAHIGCLIAGWFCAVMFGIILGGDASDDSPTFFGVLLVVISITFICIGVSK